MTINIRPVNGDDAQSIVDIYNHFIEHSVVTFENDIINRETMLQRITEVSSAGYPWYVAEVNGCVSGYAYASRWKPRAAYKYSAEVSVYIASSAQGKGLGFQLYQQLFSTLKQTDIHTLIAGITLPNPASVALHEKLGMTFLGSFKEVGYKFDAWQEVGYWQLQL